MIPLANRKILSRFMLFGLVVTLYDMILHSLLVVIHIAFEWFELGLEEIIEHIFHTSRQQSQIIVFYLLWLMALCVLYYLWRTLPGLYNRFKTQLLAASSEYKAYIKDYWSEQSSSQKIKWLTSFTVSVSCLAFLAFS
ncbi:hypothetical protein [Methylobacter svalbardensis]|uniref:hypothetical protein n=1 Tax=Methylobacter svalbardensis TaxID=3080016 RepID=UPI0030EB3E8D